MLTVVRTLRCRPPGPLAAAVLLARMRPVQRRVGRLLQRWHRRAVAIPDPELRRQAVASLESKAFHCHGGAVFALAVSRTHREDLLGFIVALQTISDYLDNLCDRSLNGGEGDLRRLHRAYLDALDPGAPPGDYYAAHPAQNDGGYLPALVRACHRGLRGLGAYPAVQVRCAALAASYVELQVLKHLPGPDRVDRVARWATGLDAAAGLPWWELAAAAGSTLGLFALAATAADAARLRPGAADAVAAAYFPHVAALHILLDYLVDLEEDRSAGDLNFVEFYSSPAAAQAGIEAALRRAAEAVAGLPGSRLHALVVAGLPAIYLADAKADRPAMAENRRRLLRLAGPAARALHAALRGPGRASLGIPAGRAGWRRA